MLERLPEFIGNHPIMSFGFIALVAALIFTEIARRFRGFKAIGTAEAIRLINRDDAMVVDVSAVTDFEKGHIVDAAHVLPSQVDPQHKPFAGRGDKPIVVYCKTGMASESVAKRLVKAGLQDVYWLQGGLNAWLQDELPVTRKR